MTSHLAKAETYAAEVVVVVVEVVVELRFSWPLPTAPWL